MKSILSKTIFEIEEKKSKFIGILCHIDNKDEVLSCLALAKEEYPKATHYCYAYIVDSYEYCNDDGEPSKTGGFPILNVLKENNLSNCLGIVVRYFGGTKLGTGGLVRAYTKAIKGSLEKGTIVELVPGYLVKLSFTYEEQKQIDYLLKDSLIREKTFESKITYIVEVSTSVFEILSSQKIDVQILKNLNIKKISA